MIRIGLRHRIRIHSGDLDRQFEIESSNCYNIMGDGENRMDVSLLKHGHRQQIPAHNLHFNEKIKKMQANGEHVYHFG